MTDFALPNVSHDLAGEVALGTGATSGLGERFAEVLAAGAKVIITGRGPPWTGGGAGPGGPRRGEGVALGDPRPHRLSGLSLGGGGE